MAIDFMPRQHGGSGTLLSYEFYESLSFNHIDWSTSFDSNDIDCLTAAFLLVGLPPPPKQSFTFDSNGELISITATGQWRKHPATQLATTLAVEFIQAHHKEKNGGRATPIKASLATWVTWADSLGLPVYVPARNASGVPQPSSQALQYTTKQAADLGSQGGKTKAAKYMTIAKIAHRLIIDCEQDMNRPFSSYAEAIRKILPSLRKEAEKQGLQRLINSDEAQAIRTYQPKIQTLGYTPTTSSGTRATSSP